jgi:glycosyltransferase involved in cell wall biosynthesis
MLRVLALSTLFPNAGRPNFGIFVERRMLRLAARDGVEVEVVAPVPLPPWPLSAHPHYRGLKGLPREEAWKGIRVHRPAFSALPILGGRTNGVLLARAVLPLLRRIRERFPFDLIDAEFFWPDGVAARHLSRALGVPFSVTARGSDINQWMNRPGTARQILAAGHEAAGMLAVSEALRGTMAKRGLPAARITTLYTAVDGGLFHPRDRAAEKAKLGVAGPLLVTVGALIPGKGQRDAIAATEKLPGAILIIAGEGPDRAALEALISTRGLRERVRLIGSRPPQEIASLLAAADVMVLPSRSEGLANVWVEAIASGTPVVTADVGGAREVIDRPELGALVPNQPEAIAAAVARILADPPDPALVVAGAEKFSPEVNIARLHDYLLRVAEQSPPPCR